MALDGMLGWRDKQAVGKIGRFLSNFSAKNPLINSYQAHQIAAHPFHHLPMGLPDDNPSSVGYHYGFGRHAGLDGLASWLCCKIWRFLSNFSDKNLLIKSHQAHQIAAHPFHHLPMGLPDDNPSSVGYHYGFGCHAGLEGLTSCAARLGTSCPTFQPKTY
jgi:hypothetical protein